MTAVAKRGKLTADVNAQLEREMFDTLDAMIEDSAGDPKSMIGAILAADSAEDILGGIKPISGKSFTGRPFRILEWNPVKSDFDNEGYPYYLSMWVENPKGEQFRLNCGGGVVVASVYALSKHNALGDDFYQLVEVKLKGTTNTALNLRAWIA